MAQDWVKGLTWPVIALTIVLVTAAAISYVEGVLDQLDNTVFAPLLLAFGAPAGTGSSGTSPRRASSSACSAAPTPTSSSARCGASASRP